MAMYGHTTNTLSQRSHLPSSGQEKQYSESPYGGGMSSGYTRTAHELEGQNDERLDGLLGKVKILKDITTGIGSEVRDSNQLLGGMLFHEGLKSWSCCNETNKPVLEFDAFMSIPPCTKGSHSSASKAAAPKANTTAQAPALTNVSSAGVETYGTASVPKVDKPVATAPITTASAVTEQELKEENDDPSLSVPAGAKCKRLGCGAQWEGEAISRGTGENARCRYHPQPAIFHEGSKGYLCCKRRVLEFSEFLKIEGCKEGAHLFVGEKKDENKEELINCRLDHYQTPTQVHVSAFAKSADKDRSTIEFTSQNLSLSLYLPQNKRVAKTITLYGPIDPSQCSFRILGTKVEIILTKPKPASWPLLELPPAGTELPPGYALTFGVSGRTGTIGGKEIVLAPEEIAKRG
ncbi:hypothetical protein L204_100892 [Cryptococcus depauperatus]